MPETTKTEAAALRNEVYQFLKDNGIELKGAQTGLSKILKKVYDNRIITVTQEVQEKVEQEITLTCPSCLGVRKIVTKEGKRLLVNSKKMSEFRTKGFVKSGARDNLRKMVEEHPRLAMECIDAAYVAGVDDAKKTKEK